MPILRLRRHLSVLTALAALAALPAAAHAAAPESAATSGHAGDPSGPPPAPQDPPPQGDGPQSGSPVGVTQATPGDTFDVVASAAPARVSRRVFTIRIARGIHVASAEVWVAGRPVPVHHGHRTSARVDLRGMPGGRVTVRLRVRTREGAVIEASRVYRTCAARRAGGVPSV